MESTKVTNIVMEENRPMHHPPDEDYQSYHPPQPLIDYINEQVDEGHEVRQVAHEDGYTWYFGLEIGGEPWLVVVQWYYGSDDYSVINLNGRAYQSIKKFLLNGV